MVFINQARTIRFDARSDQTMTEPNFISDEAFKKLQTITRLRRTLQLEGKAYLRALHGRCGVGLTVEEFDSIILGLECGGWCSTRQGSLGATLVIFNEQFNNVNVPEVPNEKQP